MTTSRRFKISSIDTEDDLLTGVRSLKRRCPVMKRLHVLAGDPPMRRWPDGFPGLARIVVGQQLSIASAGAIWQRVSVNVDPLTPATILDLDDSALIACGLSRPKIKTLRALAQVISSGALDLGPLERAPDESVRDALTQVPGIGPWTADIYLLFCLGRRDAWAPGDLALQIATERAFSLRSRPDSERLEEIAERWRPWRGVAARLLWAYYALPRSNPARTAVRMR